MPALGAKFYQLVSFNKFCIIFYISNIHFPSRIHFVGVIFIIKNGSNLKRNVIIITIVMKLVDMIDLGSVDSHIVQVQVLPIVIFNIKIHF